MDIKEFNIPRFDMMFVLCWTRKEGYYVQALERGEWVENFADLPQEKLPKHRDDDAAIRAMGTYVGHVKEELEDEAGRREPEPDWELQARYDEMHGTINGQDPNVARWYEEFGGHNT